MKLMKCVIALAVLLVAAPIALLAQQQMNCPDDCIWIQGLGWKCGDGSAGCKCHDADYSCTYYNCGGPICGPAEDEEDEESEAGAAARGPTLGVQLVEVGGELFVVVDYCLKSAPMLLRVGAGTSVEIVQPLSGFSSGQ